MQLVKRKSQVDKGIFSKTVHFILAVRAELTDEEKLAVKRYKLGSEVLYDKLKVPDPGYSLLGIAARIALKAINLTITVDDLIGKGKEIKCDDILEIISAEAQVMEAFELFKRILDTCRGFEGEQIIQM
jgi:hypothetical protein